MEEPEEDKYTKAARKRWEKYTPEMRALLREKIAESVRKHWAGLTPEERQEMGRKVSRAKRERAIERSKEHADKS